MRPLLRSAFLALLLGSAGLALLARPAFAQDSTNQDSAQGYEATLKTPAGKFIQDLGDRAISIIANKNLTPNQRSDEFKGILTDSFDLMTIGRFVIGRSWNQATSAQQEEYMRLFKDLVVKSYGDRLSLYTGEGFKVTGVRPESEKDVLVTSDITHPDGSQPTEVDWRVRKREGKLGVIDVMVEGVSLSVTQRQEYAAVLQRNGGQIDGLLSVMRQQLQTPATSNQPG